LALAPLAEAIDGAIVDAKSGVSGAGRSLKPSSHAGFVLENFSPYAVGVHRHAPEIAQQLGLPVCFVPHLLPVRRGLLATCYVQAGGDVRALLEAAYAASPVVRVLPEGVAPELARVQGTDAAEIGVFADTETGTSSTQSRRRSSSTRASPTPPRERRARRTRSRRPSMPPRCSGSCPSRCSSSRPA